VDLGLNILILNVKFFHPALKECVENAAVIQKQIVAKRKYAETGHKNFLKDSVGILGDGWQIYGGWYPPSLMGKFNASYTLPNQAMADSGQIMYYFIGMQNNDQPTDVTIIQPVITYCNSGCANTEKGSTLVGWSGNSWNCCPSGQTWFSNPIQLTAGQSNVMGLISTNDVTGVVNIVTSDGTAVSNLTITSDFRKYNWADVTLEAYDYGVHCTAFNSMPFYFNSMAISDASGNILNNPAWNIVNDSNCNGYIVFSNGGLTSYIVGTS